MTRSQGLRFRAIMAALAFAAGALPSAGHAACTPIESSIALGQVTSASQFKAKQGEVVNGSLVRGVAAPISVRLTGCSSTLPTTVRADRVPFTSGGGNFNLVPWLISVDGVTLATPKDISLTTHQFLGNVTLEILFVPENLPPSLAVGQYNGPLILTFTD